MNRLPDKPEKAAQMESLGGDRTKKVGFSSGVEKT
jgi:hypothetical protein